MNCLPCSQCSFPQCVTSDVVRENRDCLFGKHLNTGSAAPGILLKFRHLTIEHWSIVPLRDVSYYFWATYKLDIEVTNTKSVDLFPSRCFCRMDIFVLTYFFTFLSWGHYVDVWDEKLVQLQSAYDFCLPLTLFCCCFPLLCLIDIVIGQQRRWDEKLVQSA